MSITLNLNLKSKKSFLSLSFILTNEAFFFTKIFNEDGTEADEYDVFFTTTKDIMKEFCKEKNLDFPVPESREDDFIWIYGLVYDKNTLEIKQVKGYVRYPTDEGEWI